MSVRLALLGSSLQAFVLLTLFLPQRERLALLSSRLIALKSQLLTPTSILSWELVLLLGRFPSLTLSSPTLTSPLFISLILPPSLSLLIKCKEWLLLLSM